MQINRYMATLVPALIQAVDPRVAAQLVNAKIKAISSDIPQLQLIKLHHFKVERFKLI